MQGGLVTLSGLFVYSTTTGVFGRIFPKDDIGMAKILCAVGVVVGLVLVGGGIAALRGEGRFLIIGSILSIVLSVAWIFSGMLTPVGYVAALCYAIMPSVAITQWRSPDTTWWVGQRREFMATHGRATQER